MRVALFFLGILISVAAHATPNFDAELFKLGETFRKATPNAGMAIGIVTPEGLISYSLHGNANAETRAPITLDSLFMIGSTTKAFTSTAAGQLVEQGRLSFDSEILSVLPEFALSDPSVTAQVTVRDALLHRVGIPRYDLYHMGVAVDRQELFSFLPKMQFAAPFREHFIYNNFMYGVVGQVIERVTRRTWSEIVHSQILDPLEMDDTRTTLKEIRATDQLALPHAMNHKGQFEIIPMTNLNVLSPAGSIHSSLNDLAHWIQMHLNKGMYEGRSVVGEYLLNEILSPQILTQKTANPSVKNRRYALGWSSSKVNGREVIGHGGGVDGYLTHIAFMREEKVGVIVLTNGGSMAPEPVALTVLNNYVGGEPLDLGGSDTNPTEPKPEHREYMSDTSALAGTYYNNVWREVSVSSIVLEDGSAGVGLKLNNFELFKAKVYEEEDRFVVEVGAPWSFFFVKSKNGEVEEFSGNFEPLIGQTVFGRVTP